MWTHVPRYTTEFTLLHRSRARPEATRNRLPEVPEAEKLGTVPGPDVALPSSQTPPGCEQARVEMAVGVSC